MVAFERTFLPRQAGPEGFTCLDFLGQNSLKWEWMNSKNSIKKCQSFDFFYSPCATFFYSLFFYPFDLSSIRVKLVELVKPVRLLILVFKFEMSLGPCIDMYS